MSPVKVGLAGLLAALVAALSWSALSSATQTRELREELSEFERARQADAKRIDQLQRQAGATKQPVNSAARTVGAIRLDSDDSTAAASRVVPSAASVAHAEEEGSTAPGSAPEELVLSNMEAMFETDTRPSDAHEASGVVQQSVTPLLSGEARLDAVECRASMCRLVSTQPDLEQYRKFAFDVIHSEVCRECFYTQTGESADGKPILTVYMARKGHQLPRIE